MSVRLYNKSDIASLIRASEHHFDKKIRRANGFPSAQVLSTTTTQLLWDANAVDDWVRANLMPAPVQNNPSNRKQ
ncbi:MAG: hypothetical protein AAF404_12765 [Pseudomonadota bacterium]